MRSAYFSLRPTYLTRTDRRKLDNRRVKIQQEFILRIQRVR